MMAELDLRPGSPLPSLMENTENRIYQGGDCRLLGVSRRMAVTSASPTLPSSWARPTSICSASRSVVGRSWKTSGSWSRASPSSAWSRRRLEGSALIGPRRPRCRSARRLGRRHRPHGDHARSTTSARRAVPQHLAAHDQLAVLPNRYLLMDRWRGPSHTPPGSIHLRRALPRRRRLRGDYNDHGHEFGCRPPVARATLVGTSGARHRRADRGDEA